MTYHHKKDRYLKDTKEIVENILPMKASDYDLTEPSDIVTSGKTIQIIFYISSINQQIASERVSQLNTFTKSDKEIKEKK